ncbi:GTPase-activating protein and VPS9 domain-containing protein 1-like isoform X6 [Ostrea edulis]|uniref:GTPase-activating protein and VPS9 domain-containing protein 1-like isoform X6 n=1 Tax=Ostrea edulis TaxID=37623 RepID=UPI0024AF872C|nr:GTPase-activating protein and VPS9 domain-containing protein 1-like isoform X6 [Ostrea edulis]
MELLELARQLKQEQLFVNAEKTQIHTLYEEAKKVAEDLYHESWIVRQQRTCLEQLQASSNSMTPKECYTQTNNLEFTNFVDSYKSLSYHESKYGEFLKFLKDNHFLIASLIDCTEKNSQESLKKFISLLVTSVFGNVVFPEDEVSVIQTVKYLAELQLATSDNPRVLLRKVNCGFSVSVKLLFDSLYSSKLFLTAALHDPVMRLLMEDEWFYDIDPEKALHRFPPQERIKRFGDPVSADYEKKCIEYRKFIVDKLVVLTNRFIISIKNNMHCFPSNLAWLIAQVYQALIKTGRHGEERARAVCGDLVFSLFICPAIIDPDPYGITSDIYISHIARHNLMQIAQIIQVLALSQWEAESKEKDLYERFEKGCITSLLDFLLEGIGSEVVTPPSISVSRSSVLITLQDLNFLISLTRTLSPNLGDSVAEKKQLEELLSRIPTLLNCPTPSTPQPSQANSTPPGTPKERKTPKDKKRGLPEGVNAPAPLEDAVKEILVVPLNMDSECPGMMSEQKVLSMEQENKPRRVKYHDVPHYEVAEGGGMFTSKRTRFSLSQDQESIGNTSEIQEAFSEAASSHSVGSVEEDDDNDNMSDMISANVSGRGTPNISGRDTPLSQAGSVEEPPPPQMPLPEIPPLPQTIPKPNREDVTDRFGKFEIRAEIERVETKSTVSDTWSTDVLASDSEPPPESNQYDRLEELVRSSFLPRQDHVSEVSETASDAWSTDVLASDTEDKQALSEFDQDDVGSVTDLASIMSGDAGNLENAEGRRSPSEDLQIGHGLEAAGGAEAVPPPLPGKVKVNRKPGKPLNHNEVFFEEDPFHLSDSNRLSLPPPKPAPRLHSARAKSSNLLAVPEHSSSQKPGTKKSRSAVVYGATYSSSDSGFGGTPQSIDSQSLDSLIETSTNVKFSEQQNTTFNTKRLSAALAMFDPVSTDSSENAPDTLIDIREDKMENDHSAVKSWADSAASLQEAFKVDTLISVEESKTTPPVRSRQDSLTSDSSGSDGVPFAKSSRSASFDNVSEKSEEKEATVSKDKGQKDGNKSFFRNLKVKLNKGMKKKSLKSSGEDSGADTPTSSLHESPLVDTSVEGAEGGETESRETSEDILEKYRPKPSTISTATQEMAGLAGIDVTALKEKRMSVKDEDIQGPALYDPDNLETCFAFTDTKRKLRIVLSNTDVQLGYNLLEFSPQVGQDGGKKDPVEIYKMLRGQLAEAINLQDKDLVAQLHEAIRCVRLFEGEGCRKLVRSLQEDYQSRAVYISYLVRCRQGLLGTHSHLQRLLTRIKRDKEVCGNHLTRICVKMFIEKKESSVVRFMADFQKLTVSDEKTDHVEQFLQYLYQAMNQDSVWLAANESQIEDAQLAIERYIMSRIYTHAMFPNGDGDIMRDQLFHEHLKKLSQVITPSHKDLRIPRMYQFECPWTAAQKEIYMINAYKTPKDKVKCVFRCATTIMNLLSMANEKAVPAADDFIPVLIFVIIKANPPCLLSTIQYVQSFYGNRIGGEEQYWWIQFCSAAEFIKTMEYTTE